EDDRRVRTTSPGSARQSGAAPSGHRHACHPCTDTSPMGPDVRAIRQIAPRLTSRRCPADSRARIRFKKFPAPYIDRNGLGAEPWVIHVPAVCKDFVIAE